VAGPFNCSPVNASFSEIIGDSTLNEGVVLQFSCERTRITAGFDRKGEQMAVLTDAEIQQELTSLNGWQHNGEAIQRVFRFPDFKVAMQFVNKVAEAAEQANHHPDIDIRYNTITMALVSHDAGGVTNRDVRMAGTINKIAG
jgi:4a-hydroxytetrahydrobiopterin dehydratase